MDACIRCRNPRGARRLGDRDLLGPRRHADKRARGEGDAGSDAAGLRGLPNVPDDRVRVACVLARRPRGGADQDRPCRCVSDRTCSRPVHRAPCFPAASVAALAIDSPCSRRALCPSELLHRHRYPVTDRRRLVAWRPTRTHPDSPREGTTTGFPCDISFNFPLGWGRSPRPFVTSPVRRARSRGRGLDRRTRPPRHAEESDLSV